MLSSIRTATLNGIDGTLIQVETDITRGLPACNLVGLPDTTIRESLERIRSAIMNSGFDYPAKRMTINLAPAGTRKDGSHFDLPVAIGVLAATGQATIQNPMEWAFLGELSLDGKLNPVKGVLPLVMCLKENGVVQVVLPYQNMAEAGMVEGISLYPAGSLEEAVDWTRGFAVTPAISRNRETKIPIEKPLPDFMDVAGHENVKRALALAAAGAHGLLMVGPPGCGKTMLASRLPSILPPMSAEERMSVAQIYSVAGLIQQEFALLSARPFRRPHHSITRAALLGGGMKPGPGELSLAHNGVLFLDEVVHFDSGSLEALRQPLEEGQVTITRRGGNVTFPSQVILVAACNPCKCGYAGDPRHQCTCSDSQITQYRSKLSGPILDRIDIHVQVDRVPWKELNIQENGLSSSRLRQMVIGARKRQLERYQGKGIYFNGQLSHKMVVSHCVFGKEQQSLMRQAYETFPLNMRTYDKILRLARTIADIENQDEIAISHLAEALQYREFMAPARGHYE